MEYSPSKYSVDWDQQWAAHAQDFRDGCAHLSLLGCHELKLAPGPGFGDLSHPTTRLVLQLMAGLVKGKHVIDVGCGSGVLSLAACALGAASVHALDIDPEAVAHARANSVLNGMEKKITYGLPGDYTFIGPGKNYFILMNMIQSEQFAAWNSLNKIHGNITDAVTSGILLDGLAEYENLLDQWNLHSVELVKEDPWIALRCKKIN